MDTNDVLTRARNFLKERTDALSKDVKHCLFAQSEYAPAPFPALLYCFSTIDLLGELYGYEPVDNRCPLCGKTLGKSVKNPKGVTLRSRAYMTEVMKYTEEVANRLQKVFRHKLVHLAQPNLAYQENGKKIGWEYHHDNRAVHLTTTEKDGVKIFRISIGSLCDDIVDSVYKPEGYLHKLSQDEELRVNFEKAYKEIYSW
ncbi:MAG: hypothetical protein OEV59_07860 [Deltaproteobacteria bacterium]|nr:hypothetical protein [Deltaproteobacteria bacterium]